MTLQQIMLGLGCAVGLIAGAASSGKASPCGGCFVPEGSELAFRLGGLPRISIAADPNVGWSSGGAGWIPLMPPPGYFAYVTTPVWSTVNFGPGTALFTGVPLISHVRLTVVNDTGFVRSGFDTTAPMGNWAGAPIGPTLGGHIRLTGQVVIEALGEPVAIGLSHVGGVFGETTTATIAELLTIRVEHGPFVTEALVITQVTSNLISIPGRTGQKTGVAFTLRRTASELVRTFNTTGGFQSLSGGLAAENHTVTISGSPFPPTWNTHTFPVSVVSPIRIDTGTIAGVIPGAVEIDFIFAPEPGALVLLVSGAFCLSVLARRRLRRRISKDRTRLV